MQTSISTSKKLSVANENSTEDTGYYPPLPKCLFSSYCGQCCFFFKKPCSHFPVLNSSALFHCRCFLVTLSLPLSLSFSDSNKGDEPTRDDSGPLPQFSPGDFLSKKNLPPFDKKSPPFSQTARDTLEISVAPVIFSHSSAQALCNSARNVPDQLLKLTVLSSLCLSLVSTFCPQAAKKGLVMINFFSYFITCSNVSSLNDVIGRQATIL